MFRFVKVLFLSLCFVLLYIAVILYYEDREINLGGTYYLKQFSPDERWYVLYSRYPEVYIPIPDIGVIDYYQTKDYYIPYGLFIKLCDKQGLYHLWNNDKYYYVIDRHLDNLVVLKGDREFEIFSNAHNINLKPFSIPEEFLEKIRVSHNTASKDGCLYD